VNAHRKFGSGNLRPALTSNSEEAELLKTIIQTRGGESIGFLIELHDSETQNVASRAKLPRTHEDSVENEYFWEILDI
jgi:hypothetical protein